MDRFARHTLVGEGGADAIEGKRRQGRGPRRWSMTTAGITKKGASPPTADAVSGKQHLDDLLPGSTEHPQGGAPPPC